MTTYDTSAILANVATTLFQAGAKDIVATPDVYGINTNQVINTPAGKFNPFSGGFLSGLRGGPTGILNQLTSLTTINSLAPLANNAVANLTSRLGSAIGLPLSSLPTAIQYNLSQAANFKASLTAAAYVTVGNITRGLLTDDLDSAQTSVNLVNQMSGNYGTASFVDTGAQSTALTAITSQLITLGLSEAVSALISSQSTVRPNLGFGAPAPSVVQQALGNNLQQAIQASDLSTVQLCITQLGVGGVLSKVPDAGKQLVKFFKIPKGTNASGYPALYSQLKGILVQLDPSWDVVERSGSVYPSLAYYAVASQDALTVMKTDSDATHQISAYIGNAYPPGNALSMLSQDYPYMLKL